MSLPSFIEIVPLTAPVRAEITVPGSKSITNRALVLAALADGETILQGALWSEDTQVMVECLQELGFMVNVAPDPNEPCNRTITVYGLGGKIPRGGTAEQPLELFVSNAGTAARFLGAMVCLGEGVYRLHGVSRMHERPQAALFAALRELGYRVESENGNDKLPAKIFGCSSRGDEAQIKNAERGMRNAEMDQSLLTSAATRGRRRSCTVSIEESSQFASALLLCADAGGWKVEVAGENAEESPYVAMTSKLIEAFPKRGGKFQIEPDASSGSYFWAADWILWRWKINGDIKKVTVRNWPTSGWQIDAAYPSYYNTGPTPKNLSRSTHLADSIMMAIAKASLNRWVPSQQVVTPREFTEPPKVETEKPSTFNDLGRLRVQECDRVFALRTELKKCGVHVIERGDSLEVYQGIRSPKEPIETYNDHRMAMCFAILGLKVPGIKIKNPACVKKTFPNFFQKLAAPPPHGLGATILDAMSGRKLTHEELFAD